MGAVAPSYAVLALPARCLPRLRSTAPGHPCLPRALMQPARCAAAASLAGPQNPAACRRRLQRQLSYADLEDVVPHLIVADQQAALAGGDRSVYPVPVVVGAGGGCVEGAGLGELAQQLLGGGGARLRVGQPVKARRGPGRSDPARRAVPGRGIKAAGKEKGRALVRFRAATAIATWRGGVRTARHGGRGGGGGGSAHLGRLGAAHVQHEQGLEVRVPAGQVVHHGPAGTEKRSAVGEQGS